jgi:hypothetical protein
MRADVLPATGETSRTELTPELASAAREHRSIQYEKPNLLSVTEGRDGILRVFCGNPANSSESRGFASSSHGEFAVIDLCEAGPAVACPHFILRLLPSHDKWDGQTSLIGGDVRPAQRWLVHCTAW